MTGHEHGHLSDGTAPDERLGRGPRIVVVDVRLERRALMRKMLELALEAGTVVADVATAGEALAAVERHRADAVVVEVQMPLAEGLGLIAELRAAHPSLLIVVCTFHADRATQLEASRAGADSYLVKPASARELRRALGSIPAAPLVVTSA